MANRLFSLLLLLFLSIGINAKTPNTGDSFWPGVDYNPDVPDIKTVLGHDHGMKISSPEEVVRYLGSLAKSEPRRARLVEYAQSWQGRPLVYLIISSVDNMARLEENQANMMRLANPAGLDGEEINELVESTVPVSWMSYGVHGDEISSSDAALLSAYHLLAADGSDRVNSILENSVVIIDPSQNPDGRARFVSHYRQTYGIEPAVHQLAAEHMQPWPGGRTNHYLFDMNRDWFALTQPETRGRVKHYLDFQPVVYVDVHEMGADASYYFPPPAEPFNPHITRTQKANLDLYGKANADAFDDFGFDYFTREIFDAYYPGYGDTWPGFHGAVGMTFEMSSARGLTTLRSDGSEVTYLDGVQRHFVSSITTMQTTADNRDELLHGFVKHRQSAMADKHHYLVAGGDRSMQRKMAELLLQQGVEVKQTSDKIRACGKTYKEGTIVISAGQPAGRLVRTMLDADSPAEKAFWEEKERKRAQGLEVELYDILAWSLPGLLNLQVDSCESNVSKLVAYRVDNVLKKVREAKLAYLVPWGSHSAIEFLSEALREDIVIRSAEKAFTMDGRDYEPGALIIKSDDNRERLHQQLQQLAGEYQVEVIPVDSSWTTSGINFGSNHVKQLIPPKIAIAWDVPTFSYAAGNTRYVIEREFGYPTTPVRTRHLAAPQLDHFDVLILPDGAGYGSILGKRGRDNLKAWVKDGGTMITMGRATRLLMKEGLDLMATRLEARGEVEDEKKKKTDQPKLSPATFIDSVQDYDDLLRTVTTKPDSLPGVLLKGEINQDHWLGGGVADTVNLMVTGDDIYTPLLEGTGTNLVKFLAEDEILVSGYMWEENRGQLAHKPAVMTREVGRGQVIGFTTDPAFRGYLYGLNVLLANAIFKAPAHVDTH